MGAAFISRLDGEAKSDEISIFRKLATSYLEENPKKEFDADVVDLLPAAPRSSHVNIIGRLERASGCFSFVGKPHKTVTKAFHLRGQFTGAQIRKEVN